jgi:hypothetical protein
VTDQTTAPAAESAPARHGAQPLGRTLLWLGIAGASGALAVYILRTALRRVPAGDETAERIQELIDEANRLIKTLDEKKNV